MAYDDQALVQKQTAKRRAALSGDLRQFRAEVQREALRAEIEKDRKPMPAFDLSHHQALVASIQSEQLRSFSRAVKTNAEAQAEAKQRVEEARRQDESYPEYVGRRAARLDRENAARRAAMPGLT